MFSQFRQVVDNLAPQPLRNSEPSNNQTDNSADSSHSLDMSSTSSRSTTPGQLAESALVNLRKSLSAHRSTGSIPPKASMPESKSPKLNLEDRLRRATFAIGELSGSNSPIPSGRSSPSLHRAVTKDHPLPPSSIPLPDSPMLSPTADTDSSLDNPLVINLAEDEPSKPQIELLTSADEPSGFLQKDALLQPVTQSPLEVTPSGLETLDIIPVNKQEEAAGMSDSAQVIGVSTVDDLQERLKQVEQRFTDVSTSFKRLQAEKVAADAVLRELSPLESIDDSNALREYLLSLGSKNKICQDEINQLNAKLQTQESRIDELRETHKLETTSQSDQIEKLKIQFNETDALFKDAQNSVANAERNVLQRDTDIDRLKAEVDRIKIVVKEEEEKRTKAISLLKSVRQKLVKAEKERDDATKEVTQLRDKEKADKDKMQADKVKFQQEIEALGVEKEKEKSILRLQLEKEGAVTREKLEKQISSLRSQYELDTITLKSNQSREISSKTAQITSLENSLNNITRDKNDFFDQLQLRQAELESAHAHLESLQNENTELQFQLRETGDRMAMLKEEFAELQREQEHRLREPVSSAGELAHLISTTEAKYESKLNEMKRNISSIERERNESEAEWSRKLREKVKEMDELKRVLGSAAKTREEGEETVMGLVAEIKKATDEANSLRRQVSELPRLLSRITELEQLALSRETEVIQKVTALEQLVEEGKVRESQLRQNNKTIREELRKVQSSAALLERQRNPGVGYWTSRTADNNGTEPRRSVSSISSESPSRVGSPTPSSANITRNEEEVNLEYLRNVILQFLEHKEMRPNLVKVLSIILHFTPQETRRLVAKV